MFCLDFKSTKEKIIKIALIISLIVTFILFLFLINSYCFSRFLVKDSILTDEVATLTSDNFTNVLKEVHENLDNYLGQKIHFVGFVYRAPDFNENQFVIARNMLINNDTQSLIVGFLCQSEDATFFQSGSWVEITGTITKGEYNGIIPIIKIEKIKKTKVPSKEYVHEPDSAFVPTSTIL